MSTLQEELREFNGFTWPSHLGQEQQQRKRQIRAAAKLSTVPEDTVLHEDVKQLSGPPATSFTKRAHPKIHFTLDNKGPNVPRDIKSFGPKIVQIPVAPGTTNAEIIAAAQENAAKLPGGGYRCDPARIQGKIVMEIRDSEYEVDVDSWDEVMQYLAGRSGAVGMFTYKVVGLSGCQARKRSTGLLKRTVAKAVTFLSSAMRPAPRNSIRAQSDCIAESDGKQRYHSPTRT